jgi:anti-sigma factor RsiW
MRHEEVLGKMSDYRKGLLEPAERSVIERHLSYCELCRTLAARWRLETPAGDFSIRVMARLREGQDLPISRREKVIRPIWWTRTGWVVAAALLVAAFWHPERSWVKADHSFAAFEPFEGSSGLAGHPFERSSHE